MTFLNTLRCVNSTAIESTRRIIAHIMGHKLTYNDLRDIAAKQREILGISFSLTDENDGLYPPDKGPYIFVLLNQTSLAEATLIPEIILGPHRTFANVGFLLFPFVGWMCYLLGAIPVLPGMKFQTRHAVANARRYLRSAPHHTMYMSIEGRRSRNGALSPFRLGCARIALESQATIVPFLIQGAREIMPHGSWLVRPGACKIWIGPMVRTAGLREDAATLTQRLRRIADEKIASF
jgi:hypothetical protein